MERTFLGLLGPQFGVEKEAFDWRAEIVAQLLIAADLAAQGANRLDGSLADGGGVGLETGPEGGVNFIAEMGGPGGEEQAVDVEPELLLEGQASVLHAGEGVNAHGELEEVGAGLVARLRSD